MKNSDQYTHAFGLDPAAPDPSKAKEALYHALDIRKFEITLYWQRATYFWTLIAAAFAGYFVVLGAEHYEDKAFGAYVIASIGFVFSLAWFLVNRGSKFWQENWENHVDMLEDTVTGPLYKTVLQRPPATRFVEQWIDGPKSISVSKVNQWVSLFTLLVWFVLACDVLPAFSLDAPVSKRHVVVGFLALGISLAMLRLTRSHLGEQRHMMTTVRTVVID